MSAQRLDHFANKPPPPWPASLVTALIGAALPLAALGGAAQAKGVLAVLLYPLFVEILGACAAFGAVLAFVLARVFKKACGWRDLRDRVLGTLAPIVGIALYFFRGMLMHFI